MKGIEISKTNKEMGLCQLVVTENDPIKFEKKWTTLMELFNDGKQIQ